jgi:hypothetical protein
LSSGSIANGVGPIPIETAAMAAWVRLPTPSFRKTAARCAFTVFSDRNRAREMSRLLFPSANRARMSVSRCVRLVDGRLCDSLRSPPPTSMASNRFWMTLGDRTFPPPEIATLMACSRSSGVASFSR